MQLYDMHCHVDLMPSMLKFSIDAQNIGIRILAMTTTPKAYDIETKKLSAYSNIRVALGLHPQLVSERLGELSLVDRGIESAKYIGEIGLDYSSRFCHSKTLQLEVFEHIIGWRRGLRHKVISIHSVRSARDVLDILKKFNCAEQNVCILHWYSGSRQLLDEAIELGCYFSINSYMVNSANGMSLIKAMPVDKILLESDAPFISDIKTLQQIKDNLSYVIDKLIEFDGLEVVKAIDRSNRSIFGET